MNSESPATGSPATSASYHGMASKVGSNTVANCASCHGVHDILPSSDPRSKINSAHLAETCGKCHPGANQKFIAAKVHLDGTQKADIGSKIIALISKFYVWMIVAVIGGMVLHNLIIFRKKLKLHRIGQPRILFRMTPEAARPALNAADQLLHPGAHRIRAEVSELVAGDGVHQ